MKIADDPGMVKVADAGHLRHAEVAYRATHATPTPRIIYVPVPVRDDGAPITRGVVESQIESEFSGWEGETVFVLANGQIWQQASYAYTYHYAYRPDVLIYPVRGGWEMKVEDMDETLPVKRLR